MRDCGEGICKICNQPYTKQSANSLVCGDECARERDNRRKRISKGPLPGHKISKCVICGKEFQGKLPNYPYKCCGAKECRRGMRHLAGKKSAQTIATRRGAKTIKRPCNCCGKVFQTDGRFNWTCPECKRLKDENYRFADAWG